MSRQHLIISVAIAAAHTHARAESTAHRGIIGGNPAGRGQWPEVAAVVYSGGLVGCSGVVIAPDLVLTAAHCVRNLTPRRVAVNTTELTAPGSLIPVASVWTPQSDLDVALLRLETNTDVKPRELAHNCTRTPLASGVHATVVGWGATNKAGDRWPSRLHAASVTILDTSCADPALGCHETLGETSELIAAGNSSDTCIGDSGGPLYLNTQRGPLLAGITSRGVAGDTVCGQGGIYVRADAIARIIEDDLRRRLPPAQCALDQDIVSEQVGCTTTSRDSRGMWLLMFAAVAIAIRRRCQEPDGVGLARHFGRGSRFVIRL